MSLKAQPMGKLFALSDLLVLSAATGVIYLLIAPACVESLIHLLFHFHGFAFVT